MFYLVTGLIELISMLGITIFHSGMITNICGLLMFVTMIMIPLANFMALSRSYGTPAIKVLCALISMLCTLLVLFALYKMVEIPDIGQKGMIAAIGVTAIVVYIDQKKNPGHRTRDEETQDTMR